MREGRQAANSIASIQDIQAAMRSNLRTLSIALATAVLTSIAHAGPAAEVGVTGKIKPLHSACEVRLPDEIPYGVIPLSKIDKKYITALREKTFYFAIFCGNVQRVGMRFIDAKHGTVPENQEFLTQAAQALLYPGATQESAFGLGLDSTNKKIGAMFLYLTQGENNWFEGTGYLEKNTIYAAVLSASSPHEGYSGHGSAKLVPVLDSEHLDLRNKINVHGSLTLELVQI